MDMPLLEITFGDLLINDHDTWVKTCRDNAKAAEWDSAPVCMMADLGKKVALAIELDWASEKLSRGVLEAIFSSTKLHPNWCCYYYEAWVTQKHRSVDTINTPADLMKREIKGLIFITGDSFWVENLYRDDEEAGFIRIGGSEEMDGKVLMESRIGRTIKFVQEQLQ